MRRLNAYINSNLNIKIMEDEESIRLLALTAKNDQQAFKLLYLAHSRKVFAYLFHHLKNTDEAKEVMAEAMLDVWKGASGFQGKSAVHTWIIGIAKNKMLMRFRSQKSSRWASNEDVDEFDELVPAEGMDPVMHLISSQHRKGVRRCMDLLPSKQSECLHLMYFECWSIDEIASFQQVPPGTVKSRLSHARLNITSCLVRLLRDGGGPTSEVPA